MINMAVAEAQSAYFGVEDPQGNIACCSTERRI